MKSGFSSSVNGSLPVHTGLTIKVFVENGHYQSNLSD